MESMVRRLLGAIKVYERDNLVHVEGINAYMLQEAFYGVWGTSKIGNYLFHDTGRFAFTLDSFFVPDLIYTLEKVLEVDPQSVNVRATEKVVRLLKSETWFARTLNPVEPYFKRANLSNLVYKPLPHQDEFFDNCERKMAQYHLRGYLLAADPGSGKTMMGLAMGELLETEVNIFIVPKNAIDLVWKESFENLYKVKESYWASSSPGDPPAGYRNYAFHYERLDEVGVFLKHHKFRRVMIWLDESHNLNSLVSVRTNLFLDLTRTIPHAFVFWASGTPVKAMGNEVIPLMRSIDPMFTKDVEARFTQIFGKASSRALDILNNRLGMLMHRTHKAQFRDQKPISQDLRIKIPNGERYTLDAVRQVLRAFVIERTQFYNQRQAQYLATYNAALSQYEKTLRSAADKEELQKYRTHIATIRANYDPVLHRDIAKFCNHFELKVVSPVLDSEQREKFRDARTVVKYVQLKIMGEALGRVLGKLREDCIVAMIPYAGLERLIDQAQKKVLIFSTYVSAIKATEAYLYEKDYRPLLVYGETNKDLNSIVKRFAEEEDINPLLATFASLSTTVPLTMANVCIMLNMPFRDHIYTQAISRVDRIGQDTQVYLFNLYLDTGGQSNLSTRAGDILEWCREQVEQILGKPISAEDTETIAAESHHLLEPEPAQVMHNAVWVRW